MKTRALDLFNLKRTIVLEAKAWQSEFLSARDLQRFVNDRGISLAVDQVQMLWELGLLQADFVTAPHSLDVEGFAKVEAINGDHYYSDVRPLLQRDNGWLSAGGQRHVVPDATAWFHPFRYYVLHHLRRVFDVNVSPWQSVQWLDGCSKVISHAQEHLTQYTQTDSFVERVMYWNDIATLVIGLEPTQLPGINRSLRYGQLGEQGTHAAIDRVKHFTRPVLLELTFGWLKELHQDLCIDTQMVDHNPDLHTIVRLAKPEFGRRLRGQIGGAIVVRTMAEILRRATEEVFHQEIRGRAPSAVLVGVDEIAEKSGLPEGWIANVIDSDALDIRFPKHNVRIEWAKDSRYSLAKLRNTFGQEELQL